MRVDEIIGEICQDLASMKAPVKILNMEAVTISSPPLALTRAVRNLVINAATHGGGALLTFGVGKNTPFLTIDDGRPGNPQQKNSPGFETFFPVPPARRP